MSRRAANGAASRSAALLGLCALASLALACGKYGRPERVYSEPAAAVEAPAEAGEQDAEEERKRAAKP